VATWEQRLVEDDARLRQLLLECRRIAVLGIKTEAQAGQPAIEVPRYLAAQGYDIIPVPVYYPDVQSILGRPVYRRVQDVPGGVDLVDVFRRPADIPSHLDDLLAARPRVVWFQLGIRHNGAARRLAEAGILVVQDRCTLIEHRRLLGRPVR
jgi:predicted CoA-binding protein